MDSPRRRHLPAIVSTSGVNVRRADTLATIGRQSLTLTAGTVTVSGSFVVFGNNISLTLATTGALLAVLRNSLPAHFEVTVPAGMQIVLVTSEPGLLWPVSGAAVSGASLNPVGTDSLSVGISCSEPLFCVTQHDAAASTTAMPNAAARTMFPVATQTRLTIPTGGGVEASGAINKGPETQSAAGTFNLGGNTWSNALGYYWSLLFTPAETFVGGATYAFNKKGYAWVRSPWYFYIGLQKASGLWDQFWLGDLAAMVKYNESKAMYFALSLEMNALYTSGVWGVYTDQAEEGVPNSGDVIFDPSGIAYNGVFAKAWRAQLDWHPPIEYQTGNTPGAAQNGMQGRATVIYKVK